MTTTGDGLTKSFPKMLDKCKLPAKLECKDEVKPITLPEGGKRGKYRNVCLNLFLD